MMRFEHPEYLYGLLLLLLPLAAFVVYAVWRERILKKYGDRGLLLQLMPERSKYKVYIKFVLVALAYMAFVLAIANPQLGKKVEKVQLKGADIFIAIDVSNSMLAEDLKPNRISRAKQFISNLVDQIKNDRVGLIVFAGNSYLQMPLTNDKVAAKLFLTGISTDMAPTQGTSLAKAIRMAMESFNKEEGKYKAMVILSDGEDHEGEALVVAEEAANAGVTIHTIGIGDPKGAPIPVMKKGNRSDFKRDAEGNIVLSKLNETILQQVAATAGGQYFRLGSSTNELGFLLAELENLEKKDLGEMEVTDYKSYYHVFVLIGFVLLILETLMAERRSKWIRSLNLFGNPQTEKA